jgi:hypothetical protein
LAGSHLNRPGAEARFTVVYFSMTLR